MKYQKKLKYAVTSVLLILTIAAFGQRETELKRETINRINDGFNSNDLLYGVPQKPPGLEGSPYYFEDWQTGSITFNKTVELKKVLYNYDLLNNVFEIIDNEEKIRILPEHKVNAFNIAFLPNGEFIPVSAVAPGGKETGFYRVLHDGDDMLLSYTEVYIKKADYNQALDVGNRNDEIIRKESFYHSSDKKTTLLKRKKDLMKVFKSPEMKSYLKKSTLKMNSASDLSEVFTFSDNLN